MEQTHDTLDAVASHLQELEDAWLRIVREAEQSAKASSSKQQRPK